jgi:hypothetical protein
MQLTSYEERERETQKYQTRISNLHWGLTEANKQVHQKQAEIENHVREKLELQNMVETGEVSNANSRITACH